MNTWTRFTDFDPTTPFWSFNEATGEYGWYVLGKLKMAKGHGMTHWMSAEPPSAKTIRDEEDGEAFATWFSSLFGSTIHSHSIGQRDAWLAALAYERKRVGGAK